MAHQRDCMERQTIVLLIFSLNLGLLESFKTVQRSASVQTSLLQCRTCGTIYSARSERN